MISCLAICLLGICLLGQDAQGQESATPTATLAPQPAVEIPDAKSIEEKLKLLESATDMEAGLKDELTALYSETLTHIQKAQEQKARVDQHQKNLDELPTKTDQLRELLAQPVKAATPSISDASTLMELEQYLSQTEAELETARGAVTNVEQALNEIPEARKTQSEKIGKKREELKKHRDEKGTDITEDMDPQVREAKETNWRAKEAALYYEIQALEKQAPLFDVRSPYLTLNRDLAVREVARLETKTEALRQEVTEERQREAERAAAKARMEARAVLQAATSDPDFKKLAESIAQENARLTEARTGESRAGEVGTLKGIEGAANKLKEIKSRNRQVIADFDRIKKRIEAVGLDNAFGPVLRKYRAELPNFRQHFRNVTARNDRISRIEIERLNLEDQRSDLSNLDAVIKQDLSEIPTQATEAVRAKQEQLLRTLRETQKKYIEDLQGDYSDYIGKLTDLNDAELELAENSESFSEFINENVLWIPSANAFSPTTLKESINGAIWFLNARRWLAVVMTLGRDSLFNAPVTALFLVLFAFLLLIRPRIKDRIAKLGVKAERNSTARLNQTFRCLFDSVVLSIIFPSLLYYLGWRLSETSYVSTNLSSDELDFVRAVGNGFSAAALVLLILNAFRYTLIPKGVAVSHFDWPENQVAQIRLSLRWLTYSTLPLLFVVATLQWYRNENYQETLGRLLFVFVHLIVIYFGHISLRFSGGPFQDILDFKRGSGRNRFRHLWYAIGVGIPLVVLILAFMGYYYTSLRLAIRYYNTLTFVLVLTIIYGCILRWLFLARKKIAMEQARKRRDLARAKESDDPRPEVEIEEEVLDLTKIDYQTKQLVRSLMGFVFVVGFWFIWAEELPALSILGEITIWDPSVTTVTTNAEGIPVTETIGEPITLTHLVFAFLIGLLTVAATKNLPAFLEISFLQRLELAAGERYALTTIIRYVILATGVALIFHAVGIGWANLQWLVAAVGLGLGFGLQEIFANFISGIILLFERPIRVGDTVTVGEISGTVSRINIRATTITDFDRKELVVPNKEFVTGQLINWSLSDPILRFVVPVGIAYGSDTELAKSILEKVAEDEPLVIRDPPPTVIFCAFGASSLDFELRAFVKGIEDRLAAIHSVHMTIDREFRKAGIEIAFPQQDLHVRSVSESILRDLTRRGEKFSERG